MTPPSDEYENYVVPLKEQSLVKKALKSASKSAYNWQRKACLNYAPLERTVLRTLSVTDKTRSLADADILARRLGLHSK